MTNYANKYNKGTSFNEKANKDSIYKKLSELFKEYGQEKEYRVLALYINTKSKYGDSPVVYTDGNILVNLPNHLLDTVKEMRKDSDFVEACNRREVAFKIYPYENSNGVSYSVNWKDVETDLPF